MWGEKRTRARTGIPYHPIAILTVGLVSIFKLVTPPAVGEDSAESIYNSFEDDLELLAAARVTQSELTNNPGLRRCLVQMRLLGDALSIYQEKTGNYPDRLKDLMPDLLADPSLLLCPESEPGNNFGGQPQFLNNSEPFSTYDFQYSAASVSYLNRKTKKTESATLADFKAHQRRLTGDVLPLLRCHLHGDSKTFDPEAPRQIVNLSLNGIAFWSGGYWESVIVSRIARPYLTRDSSFDSQVPIPDRAKARDTELDETAIDLSRHYNALPNDPWLYGKGDTTMSSLPLGKYTFQNVSYDLRGFLQLGGPRLGNRLYPSQILGIQIGKRAAGLDIIQACAHEADPNDTVGELRIHLKDQAAPEILTLRYKENTGHMRVKHPELDQEAPLQADIAWQGQTKASKTRNEWLRLFHIRWTNPHPENEIQSLDFHSHKGNASPFLAAVTVWRSQEQNSTKGSESIRDTNQTNK